MNLGIWMLIKQLFKVLVRRKFFFLLFSLSKRSLNLICQIQLFVDVVDDILLEFIWDQMRSTLRQQQKIKLSPELKANNFEFFLLKKYLFKRKICLQ